jgi:hypothetical protein
MSISSIGYIEQKSARPLLSYYWCGPLFHPLTRIKENGHISFQWILIPTEEGEILDTGVTPSWYWGTWTLQSSLLVLGNLEIPSWYWGTWTQQSSLLVLGNLDIAVIPFGIGEP